MEIRNRTYREREGAGHPENRTEYIYWHYDVAEITEGGHSLILSAIIL